MSQTLVKTLEEMRKKLIGQREQGSSLFKCNICQDEGFTYKKDGIYKIAVKCKCQILKEIKSRKDNCGLGDLLEKRTFENYEVREDFQRGIKETAIKYTSEFLKGNRHSFAILGQSGIGKTHIMTAVAKKLIDKNIDVKYCIADEIIQTLQACKYDDEEYARKFGEIANAGVLFIDDLFKTSIQEYYRVESIKMDDLREIFKVINYRCNKNLPMLLNSEIHYEKFKELDQATIGRINEACNYEYLLSVKPDINKNYRLNGKG